MSKKRKAKPLGEVVDLFCGVGALSHGLKQAGFHIRAGYDTDARCKFAFETNNGATFQTRDVSKLTAKEIGAHFTGSPPAVLAGCAPCQPFSTYKQRYDEDPQWGLVEKFAKLAVQVAPDFVTMEDDGLALLGADPVLLAGHPVHAPRRADDHPGARRRLSVLHLA